MKFFLILLIIVGAVVVFSLQPTPTYAENRTVSIPLGAYDPNLNTPTQTWYNPAIISVKSGDTVTWNNDDKEAHTVTSGIGPGRFGWMSGKTFGEPDGMFDSGRFMPGESWSYTFDKPGTFQYFCVIHPWMEGAVLVDEKIPDYPTDGFGNRIDKFPVLMYTPDDAIEVDLTWEPNIIKTLDETKFIYQFYNKKTGVNLANMKYDFVLIQNGKEIFNSEGITTVGGDYRSFAFSDPGEIIIKFKNIESGGAVAESRSLSGENQNPAVRQVEFNTIVYENPEGGEVAPVIQPAQRLDLHYEILIAIVVVPGILFAFVIYQMKKPKKY